MKATVITTGPGRDHRDRDRVEELPLVEPAELARPRRRGGTGTIARPLPNTNAPASAKYQRDRPERRSSAAGPCRPVSEPRRQRARAPRAARGRGRRARRAARRRPRARKTQTISDSVQAVTTALTAKSAQSRRSAPSVSASSLHGAARDDRDDGGADAVEGALHPGEAAEAQVERRRARAPSRTTAGRRRAPTSVAPSAPPRSPAEVDRELRGERAGRELREREALACTPRREPAARLDEVALHVADERDRPAEARRCRGAGSRGRGRGACTAQSPARRGRVGRRWSLALPPLK